MLLSYEIEISNQKVMELMKECETIFEKDSVENAIRACEDYSLNNPLLFDGIELFEGVQFKEYFILSLKKLLINDDRYKFIKDNERYKNMVKKLENNKMLKND